MGYYMDQRDSKFTIRNEKKASAFAAVCAAIEELSYNVEAKNARTIIEALRACGWSTEEDDDGNVESILFEGNTRKELDEAIFEALAPFVEKGSFIELHGEDGLLWRWAFDGERMHEIFPTITWDMPGGVG